MDHQTIQAIATEVARHLSGYAWAALAIQVVLTVAAAGWARSSGSTSKTRGKHLATKDDFSELQRQLKANIELAGTVNS
jgi:hypothetical protein